MNCRLVVLIALLAIGAPLGAQPNPTGAPVPSLPHLTVTAVPGTVFVQGQITAAAVDRFGNLWVVDRNLPATGSGVVHRLSADGSSAPQTLATTFASPGQLAYDPSDGYVYLINTNPLLTVIASQIYRLDPQLGAVSVGSVPIVAHGFTIDREGRRYFGGNGVPGPGIFAETTSGSLSFFGPGIGQNDLLLALPSGELLAAEGRDVVRQSAGAQPPLPYYQAPLTPPNAFSSVLSLAPQPFNGFGAGALIGARTFDTFCLCGKGLGVVGDLQGVNTSGTAPALLTESYSFPFNGPHAIASGVQREAYWVSSLDGFAGRTLSVFRIEEQPTNGVHGSLRGFRSPTAVTLRLTGRPAGGDPFLLGARIPFVPTSPPVFVPTIGLAELDPFAPDYLPLFDGIGLFGAPTPLSTIPPGGTWLLSFFVPNPGPLWPPIQFQALILDDVAAPNGVLTISNPWWIVI